MRASGTPSSRRWARRLLLLGVLLVSAPLVLAQQVAPAWKPLIEDGDHDPRPVFTVADIDPQLLGDAGTPHPRL